jgi:N-acetylmuramoyl-L-alanine amidase
MLEYVTARPFVLLPVGLLAIATVAAIHQSPDERAGAAQSPSSATFAAATLQGKTIAIDPGHNGGNGKHAAQINRKVWAGNRFKPCDTVGSRTKGGYPEYAFTLGVAKKLRNLLTSAGASVVLTRVSNKGWGPCITKRAAIGNDAHADAAISIHADGGPPGGRGFHVIYPTNMKGLTDDIFSESLRLAHDVRAAYRSGTGIPFSTYTGRQGLDARGDLGGLNLSDVPKVFIESANMRNARDAKLITRAKFRGGQARALFNGLVQFLTTK